MPRRALDGGGASSIEISWSCAIEVPGPKVLEPQNMPVKAQFNYISQNGSVTITRYTGPGGVVAIPSIINRLPVHSNPPLAVLMGRPVSRRHNRFSETIGAEADHEF